MTLRHLLVNKQSERGSALVLTLLFILLLTTMSTGLYLYANQQSIYADGRYSSRAAGYIAEAGLEEGKSILSRQDMIIDTYGNGNGVIDRDDFPIVFPVKNVGNQDGMSGGKNGIGSYTLSIDAAYSEKVEMEFDLVRQPIVLDNVTFPTAAQAALLLPRTYSFKHLQIAIREQTETIDRFDIDYRNGDFILNGQFNSTTHYKPFSIRTTMNPFKGHPFFMEMTSERIEFAKYKDIAVGSALDEHDAFGNRLVLFPNSQDANNYLASFNPHPAGASVDNKMQWFQYDDNAMREEAVYVIHVQNHHYPNLQVKMHYNNGIGNTTTTIMDSSAWTTSDDAYAVLDFNPSGPQGNWNTVTNLPAHPMFGVIGAIPNAIAMEFDIGSGSATLPITVTVSRGLNDPISLAYRMRSETMVKDTCLNGDPDAADCCWYPQWPNCSGTGYEPVLDLSSGTGATATFARTEVTQKIQTLGRRKPIRTDELYTVRATGNVKQANQMRELLLIPDTYLEYSRFNGVDLTFGPNTNVAGKIYVNGDINFAAVPVGSSGVDFFDNVVLSGIFYDNGMNTFHGDAELFSHAPVKPMPGLEILTKIRSLTDHMNSDGWRTPLGREVWLFLGPYDYVKQTSNTPYGFSFAGGMAQYTPPDGSFPDDFKPYPGWTAPPQSLGTMPTPFNGVILVQGDLHVWGKLHGRPLTIMATGDITIEREIIMGTDDLSTTPPYLSTGGGDPVHLGLIACRQTYQNTIEGDIIISRHCPRIMHIESALMAPGGRWEVEDNDVTAAPDASRYDADESHLFHYPRWNGHRTEWAMVPQSSVPAAPFSLSMDINRDGRLTTGVYSPGDPAEIELGSWDETDIDRGDYIWYLRIVGPVITAEGGDASFYYMRSSLPPTAGRTRSYQYDYTIVTNPPPFFPLPEAAIEPVEVSMDVTELQSD